jgi:N6-adenosine-specific RNA methylase IME4
VTELKTPYAHLLPPLSTEEYEALVADIQRNGVQVPIVIDEDNNILDGHNRYRIDPNAPAKVVGGLTEPEKKAYVLRSNLNRRNLSPAQKSELQQIRRETALELRALGLHAEEIGAILGAAQSTVYAWLDATISITGISCIQYDARVVIPREADPVLLERSQAGETQEQIAADYGVTRQAVAKRIQQAEKRQEIVERLTERPFPAGKFSVIYADPPWSYNNSGFMQSAASHYPTMTTEEICNLPIADLSCDETVLFLWATSPLLEDALSVLRSWGFQYKASMVWNKGQAPGIGWFVLTEHEFLLIATREGNQHPKCRPHSVINSAPTRHSEKPLTFYDIIESMYDGPYCELFARTARSGWETWGNEEV